MRNTTLVHLERGGKYLMLHRVRKEHDENRDKWVGIGGKFEPGESPEDCAIREVKEETGLTMRACRYRGIVTFVSDEWGTEYMHLFHSTDFEGTVKDCDEGVLEWVDKRALYDLRSSSACWIPTAPSSPSSSAIRATDSWRRCWTEKRCRWKIRKIS